MNQHSVFWGAFDAGYLAGVEDGSQEAGIGLQGLEAALFSSLYQCGAQRFLMPGRAIQSIPVPYRSRVVNSHHDRADKVWMDVFTYFQEFVPEADDNNEHSSEKLELYRVMNFVSDLLRTVEASSSMAIAARPPDMRLLTKLLPPEVLIPIRNLLALIETDGVAAPLPRSFLRKADARVLNDLLESKQYSLYSEAHLDFQYDRKGKSVALQAIAGEAASLARRNERILATQNVLLSSLSLGNAAVELVFGKIAAGLAKVIQSPLEKWLSTRQRVIVYRFDTVLDELYKPRLTPDD